MDNTDENKEESLHQRFSQLQSGGSGGISGDYHSTSTVMLGQFSDEKQGGEVIENFHATKTGDDDGGGEILGVFQEKQSGGQLIGQRLPSLVLPLPPLSSIT